MLAHAKIEPGEIAALIRQRLAPANHGWLARRLEALWNSHSHSGSLKASDWLKETGRLLADLPQSVLETAIDEAVKRSERGFMPGVGEIRSIAEPEAAKLQKQLDRAIAIINRRNQPALAKPDEPKQWRPKPGETEAILAEYGVRLPTASTRRPQSIPTVEEYIEVCGITREQAEKLVADQKAAACRGSIGEALR